jgi:hypothetical protein
VISDENDEMANYLILSLQREPLIPAPKKMEKGKLKMEESST